MKNLENIADKFSTPLYIYDETTLCQKAEETLSFPNAFGLTVRYAMKANPNASILRIFDSLGLHFDISSGYEALRATHSGIAPNKLSISAQELPHNLVEMIEAGATFNATSLHQLKEFGKHFRGHTLGLRINPGIGSGSNAKTNVGGPSSSFGLWYQYIDQALEICQKYSLCIERIHTHIGSGSDPAVWEEVALKSLETIKHFPKTHTLNLGGGYKVARMPGEKATDLQKIGINVKKAFEKFAHDTGRKLHLEIEPGTYLIAHAGSLLTRVTDIVDTGKNGFTFLRLDTGMTEILRPALYGAQHPIKAIINRSPTQKKQSYILVGHCCESGDLLTSAANDPNTLQTIKLPALKIGNLIEIGAVGAYCSSMAAKNYNSFPEATEILIKKNNEPLLIRKRQTMEQIIENEVL